ncbi:50S ribosomal protein L4 [Candidatus Woesearchaeota archaeon]|nr:50S ribosomal protein L4 [Candidatus Woesearchaeota archaeon]
MKAEIYSVEGKKTGTIELPSQFNHPVRIDLIKRAVFAIHSHNYQPYGADPKAGTRQGKATPKRRHKFGTTYGYGISRVKRKRTWRRGSRFGWTAAFVASAVKGRKAFPPKSEKVIREKINKKERRKAICSAISGVNSLVVEDKFEDYKKLKQVATVLNKIGLKKDLERPKQKKVRAGRGTTRGRKYKRKKGLLIVASKKCPLLKSAANLPGVDITEVKNLNAKLLAPGAQPGRKTIWTKAAIEKLAKENLFK